MLTFVEVKRASDNRREVVAQMLDYAANGSVFWTPGHLRRWFEGEDRQAAMEQLMNLLDQEDQDPGLSRGRAICWSADSPSGKPY